jgi:glycosyltransferase involved in cell wall biosynthesis/ADP-heptose:LPS heptosyltransferase
MKALTLRNNFSLGDEILLTAAVRDLHRCYPNHFSTGIQTQFPQVWENNPYVHLTEKVNGSELIDCVYPLINESNHSPHHVLHGFTQFLNQRLNINIRPTLFKGDIYLSEEEKKWRSQVFEIVGEEISFWIIVAGGKNDATVKWWDVKRWQKVVDYFKNKIQFVQVGAKEHYHPKLKGVIDLRGQTNVRQLIRLVYHSQGVLCPITSLMHLAAAVEVKNGFPKNRPCVVVAGGREPSQWEAYPHHQYIHTNGALLCCDNGGCWKSRTRPLGDGDERDRPENLCVDVIRNLPRCMDMITAAEVIRRIESYFNGGAIKYLNLAQVRKAKRAVNLGGRVNWERDAIETRIFQRASKEFIRTINSYPKGFEGRGIVICAGGKTYFTCAWVCINMLRHLGCKLPIQLWYLGRKEIDLRMERLLKPLGVECVDALEVAKEYPARELSGWPLKSYAILHSKFKEVLLLDADNVPLKNPEYLFRTPQFRKIGAIFWPDVRPGLEQNVWKVFGVRYCSEPEFESGQIMVNKEKCWKALSLAFWYNEHADFYYQYVLGDKETFHMAFRKLNTPFVFMKRPVQQLRGTMCQHDFKGQRIFQHRNGFKWSYSKPNQKIHGFESEGKCFDFLKLLQKKWNGRIDGETKNSSTTERDKKCRGKLLNKPIPTLSTRSNAKQIIFRAPINAYTGYGLHALQIVSDFQSFGYRIKIRPTETVAEFTPIPATIRNKFVKGHQSGDWELLLHPPNIAPTLGKKTIYFTMWEASRLPYQWVKWLNQSECVVVPCQWNATCFSASGVDRPIYVIPLGIKADIFRFAPMDMKGPCTFGAAGKIRGGGERKGLQEVIAIFQKAFPTEKDVRLTIKAFPDCGIIPVEDPRVSVIAKFLREPEMAKWYANITCFVSVSRSEGWGLMPHQAMAVGRPCIAIKFGGHAEFLNHEIGYCADFKLAAAGYNYKGGGIWAEPNEDHIIELMRRVYRNRKEAQQFGLKATVAVSKFTWRRSNEALLRVMRDVGMVKSI